MLETRLIIDQIIRAGLGENFSKNKKFIIFFVKSIDLNKETKRNRIPGKLPTPDSHSVF